MLNINIHTITVKHIYSLIHTHTYIHIQTHTFTHMHTCTHVHTHTHAVSTNKVVDPFPNSASEWTCDIGVVLSRYPATSLPLSTPDPGPDFFLGLP